MVARLDQAAPLVGNIGLLVDAETAALWTLAEIEGVACSDGAGVVDDLVADGTGPTITESGAWAQSIARNFTAGALLGVDLASSPTTAITRDVTIQAITSLPQDGTTRPTLFCRGKGGAGDPVAFGLELSIATGSSLTVRMFWQESDGTERIDGGATFANPGGAAVVLLTATRRWEASDRVVCRYYIGEELLGESVTAFGAIGGDTAGELAIGARYSGSTYYRRWAAAVDELKITRHEMPAEQVSAVWRRLAVHQPAGYELVAALPTPGAPISGNPASRIQRILRIAGQAMGLAVARGEQLRDLLPDRAYGEVLERWERIAGLPTLGLASIDDRRARLLAHLRRTGWTADNIFAAVAELLDCDAADLELDNFSNTYTDAFASIRPERWRTEVGNSSALWSTLAGSLRAVANLGDDLQMDGTHRWGMTCVMPIHAARGYYHAARVTLTALPSSAAEAGLYLRHGYNGDHLLFGVRRTAGVYEVVSTRYRGNVAVAASTVYATVSNAPRWLRLRPASGSFIQGAADATHELGWSADGSTWSTATELWANAFRWIGFYVRGANLSANLDVRFDDWRARTPYGSRPFCVYVYRDPGLGGSPDMLGASALLKRFRHAYVHHAAISSRSLLCDDTGSGCDLGPMGGI